MVCQLARLNYERLFARNANCNHLNDQPHPQDGEKSRYRTIQCRDRTHWTQMKVVTFSAFERGLETGEFCPNDFDYVLVVREPVARMDSLVSGFRKNSAGPTVREVMRQLHLGNWSTHPYSALFVAQDRSLSLRHNGVGYGLAHFGERAHLSNP